MTRGKLVYMGMIFKGSRTRNGFMFTTQLGDYIIKVLRHTICCSWPLMFFRHAHLLSPDLRTCRIKTKGAARTKNKQNGIPTVFPIVGQIASERLQTQPPLLSRHRLVFAFPSGGVHGLVA